jgi:hypothetical protein
MEMSDAAADNDEHYSEIHDLPNRDYAEMSAVSDNDASASFHTQSLPRLLRPVTKDDLSPEQIPLSIANNNTSI